MENPATLTKSARLERVESQMASSVMCLGLTSLKEWRSKKEIHRALESMAMERRAALESETTS